MAQNALQPGVVHKFFDASAAAATTNSTPIAVPQKSIKSPQKLTWQTFYSATPTAITINIQGSLDEVNWSTLDSTTATGGEVKTFEHQLNFLRAQIAAKTGSFNTTVMITT